MSRDYHVIIACFVCGKTTVFVLHAEELIVTSGVSSSVHLIETDSKECYY